MQKIEINQTDLISKPLWFHKRNLMQTRSGFGRNLKTEWMIKYNNRLYRIYQCCISNSGTNYIKTKAGDIIIEIN